MIINVETVWRNGEDEIILRQRLLSNNITFDNEESGFRMIYVNELQIAVIEKNGDKNLYWNTEKYGFRLIFTDNISDEECLKIISSITE